MGQQDGIIRVTQISDFVSVNIQLIYSPKKSPNQPHSTFEILFCGINHSIILFGIHNDIN